MPPSVIEILLSPLAKGAYFGDSLDVARAELQTLLGEVEVEWRTVGAMEFLTVEVDDASIPLIARASCVHGLLQRRGDFLEPLDIPPSFEFPAELVFGVKYPGKTHELVTQLALNLATHFCRHTAKTLLDPMAGRGTTLLWALRYGLSSRGIEKDKDALDALHRHLKKQTKLHRLKHKYDGGFVGKKTSDGRGRFVRYRFGDVSAQLITGDSLHARQLLGQQRFDCIVADLPYGVKFRAGEQLISHEHARAWSESLKPGGAMVLIFNRYQPKRDSLIELFQSQGLKPQSFAAPHRMSESIRRDLVAFTQPA